MGMVLLEQFATARVLEEAAARPRVSDEAVL